MVPGLHIPYAAQVLFFTFCQVMGIVCAVPDLMLVAEQVVLSETPANCPMDGTIMCPPSVASSPERQLKSDGAADVDHTPIRLNPGEVPTDPPLPSAWSRSSVFSIVPISIESSSVLRI